MTELSVVLISKNQEWNVARLIESVLRELQCGSTHRQIAGEIVLVDSASTDRTTEIAARYPIGVLRLCPDQRLTAAAGRAVGCEHTRGDYVLFLDGDMELCSGWLGQALAVMAERPDVGAVSGTVTDRPLPLASVPGSFEAAPVLREQPARASASRGFEASPRVAAVEVRHGGGAAMYRRAVLEQVGGFNPYLFSDEEPALCLRIRQAGYRILRLAQPIAFHYSAAADAPATLLGRRRRNLWLGFGQNLRYFAGTPLLGSYLWERGWVLAPALGVGLGVGAVLASLLTRRWRWVARWVTGVVVLTGGLAIRKRSLKRALFTLLLKMLVLEGTVRGVLIEPTDPARYPARVEVVR
jgi:glycosyltransferase involved in cell wall biosynthesis